MWLLELPGRVNWKLRLLLFSSKFIQPNYLFYFPGLRYFYDKRSISSIIINIFILFFCHLNEYIFIFSHISLHKCVSFVIFPVSLKPGDHTVDIWIPPQAAWGAWFGWTWSAPEVKHILKQKDQTHSKMEIRKSNLASQHK